MRWGKNIALDDADSWWQTQDTWLKFCNKIRNTYVLWERNEVFSCTSHTWCAQQTSYPLFIDNLGFKLGSDQQLCLGSWLKKVHWVCSGLCSRDLALLQNLVQVFWFGIKDLQGSAALRYHPTWESFRSLLLIRHPSGPTMFSFHLGFQETESHQLQPTDEHTPLLGLRENLGVLWEWLSMRTWRSHSPFLWRQHIRTCNVSVPLLVCPVGRAHIF